MKKTLYILTFLLFISTSYSQKEYHNWVFGKGCYITFNTADGHPFFVDSLSVSAFENTSVISNSEGKLQYFSFDKYLFNSNNQLIRNNIDGHYSSIQGGSMFKVNSSHYINVSSSFGKGFENTEKILSVLNIYKDDNNKTDFVKYVIDSNYTSESLQVIKNHYNKENLLIVSDTNSNGESELLLYKFVKDNFELEQRLNIEDDIHIQVLKYNLFNNLIVGTNFTSKKFYFFRLNQRNNRIERIKKNSIFLTNLPTVSFEFSNDGKYIYVKNGTTFYRIENLENIEKEDLTISNLSSINNVPEAFNLLLGPNKKIYMASRNKNYLSSIENPDSKNNIEVVVKSVDLKNTNSNVGFPNIPTSFYNYLNINDTVVTCEGEEIDLSLELMVELNDTIFTWSGPNGFSSDLANPIIENAKLEDSGIYVVTVYNSDSTINFTREMVVDVKEVENPRIEVMPDSIVCGIDKVELSIVGIYGGFKWSTGETSLSITVTESGAYGIEHINDNGCIGYSEVNVILGEEVKAELKPVPTTICEGDSVLLESKYDADYFEYQWSTGETTKSIYASETDTYKLTITDTRTGCMDSTEIAISVEDNLQPTIIGTNICEGETATLEALPNDPSYSYEWSNGETTPTIEVNQPATYTVTVSKDGCSGSADFTVNESPNPEFEIIGEDIVCDNPVTLTLDRDFAEYLWSTDEITKEIEVTEAGTYSLTVTDANGCQATEEFTVNEQSLSFDISKDRIDFGKVYISEKRIDSTKIINTSGFQITITDGIQDYIIPDGFPVEYKKDLDPTELGPYADSFEYRVISPCDTVITIPVTAEVYARVTISSENIETEIGKEEIIPVYFEAEADLGEQTYSITTDVDRTVLFTDDDYIITQTAPINQAKTLIHEINGTIMLANELDYDITFPSYEFNNPYIEVTTEQGKIVIDSVCAFPMRSILFTETTEMKVSPNPARDRLVVVVTTGHFDKLNDQSNKSVAEPVEAQQMKLKLISSEGRVTYTENWIQTSSEKTLNINTDQIPSGLYQVRLQTPSGVLTENVIVVR